MSAPSLHQLLKAMLDKKASDLHITTGSPPQLRIDGDLVPLRTDALTPVDTKQLCYSILTDAQKLRFEEDSELDLSFGVKSLARFRANIYMQRGAVAGAFRLVPFKIIPLEELNVPPIVAELTERPRGLVLVTGPTGSGKTTVLYAALEYLKTGRVNIVTVEDPDVVLVGELRDLETIAIAIETAETGHLVFGTLHTTTAASMVS